MKTPILFSLVLLAATAAAQDSDPGAGSTAAADLFYRAYWLEHAAGNATDAEAAYQKLLDRHAAAPEAPRALLGLIRLRSAAGRDVAELSALLRREYPKAKRELDAAKRLAARADLPFSPRPQPGDSAALRRVKELYVRLLKDDLPAELNRFLADLGPVAHPALRTLLRATSPGPVSRATYILVQQRSPAAYALLERTLRDPEVLFRTKIVEAAAAWRTLFLPLVEPVAGLYPQASPLLRQKIVRAMKVALDVAPKNATAWGILARAVNDQQPMRSDALRVKRPYAEWPDAFTEAYVAEMERSPGHYVSRLANLADRPALVKRIERVVGSNPHFSYESPAHDDGRLLLTRVFMPRATTETASGKSWRLVHQLAKNSPASARLLVQASLGTGNLQTLVRRLDLAKLIDEAARPTVRAAAIEALYSGDKNRARVAGTVLRSRALPIQAADWPVIIKAARSAQGVLPGLVSAGLITAVGPERALELGRLCRHQSQYEWILNCSSGLKSRAQARPFYEFVVPRTSTNMEGMLRFLAESGWGDIIALHLLKQTGKEWRWETSRGPGPATWLTTKQAWLKEPVRSALVKHMTDSRVAIAVTALNTAESLDNNVGTEALSRALGSSHHQIRRLAISRLASRGDAGVDLLLAYAQAGGQGSYAVVRALRGYAAKRHAPGLRALLLEGKGRTRDLWRAYHNVDPKGAVELALKEVRRTDGDASFRDEALDILARTSDERRLAVFRDVLRGGLPNVDVEFVIGTVGDQYLIELGSDLLAHLRSPDSSSRVAAKTAIEALKFYAEAKKAFKD